MHEEESMDDVECDGSRRERLPVQARESTQHSLNSANVKVIFLILLFLI